MQRAKIIILTLVFSLLASSSVFAETGTISGTYRNGDMVIAGTNVNVYQVAVVDQMDNLHWRPGFESEDIELLSNTELGIYAANLADSLRFIDAEPFASTITGDYGEFTLSDLPRGIYLITFETVRIDWTKYSASPIILTMPSLDAGYAINLTVKTKTEELEPQWDLVYGSAGGENYYGYYYGYGPNTGDNLFKYIICLAIFVILEIIFLCITFRAKNKNKSLAK